MAAISSKFVKQTAFRKALWQLTDKTGKGFTAFLGPPVTMCTNPNCDGNQLSVKSVTNVTIFDFRGAHPASKMSLCCRRCDYAITILCLGESFY